MKSAGRLFRQARLKEGLTQVELAHKVDVHPNTIARIERGIQKPTFATAKKLSRALNLEMKDLPD